MIFKMDYTTMNLRKAALLPSMGAAGRRLAGLSNKICQYIFKILLIITFILLYKAKNYPYKPKLLKSMYNDNISYKHGQSLLFRL